MSSTLAGLFYSVIQLLISYLLDIHDVSGPNLIMGNDREQVKECHFYYSIQASGGDRLYTYKQTAYSFSGSTTRGINRGRDKTASSTLVGSSRKTSPPSSN